MGLPILSTPLSLREIAQAEARRRRKKIRNANPVVEFDIPDDPVDFAAECCTIRSGNQFVPFVLYDYQREMLRLIEQHRRIVIFKVRQVGASETMVMAMNHQALINPAFSGVVMSIGQSESSKLAARGRQMLATLPGLKWATNNTQELQPEGGGTLSFRPSTPNAVRGLPSVTWLLFDECDFIPNIDEMYAGAAPAQKMAGPNAKTIMVSTMSPYGELGYLWQLLAAGNSTQTVRQHIEHARQTGFDHWVDDSGWCKILIHWKAHPIYGQDPDYLVRTQSEERLTDDQLGREYDLQIPKAGASLFNPEAVQSQAIGAWCGPDRRRRYLMGVDPNFGGSDYFVAQVWDVTKLPYSLVAEYRENEQSVEQSLVALMNLCNQYRPQVCAVETNGGGTIVLERIVTLCPHTRFEKVVTSRQSKIQNTDRIAVAVSQLELIYPPDWAGISEMLNFSAQKREATTGHDDCVMCAAHAFVWLPACGVSAAGSFAVYAY